ncbi:MAG: class I SAM-dependent methyltransferase [Candidatus Binatia bacterium]
MASRGPDDRGPLRERVPEPELMDTPEQARSYAAADFSDVNQGFVDRFRSEFPATVRGNVVDLGCGPADIPLRLVSALPELRLTAVDGASAMLRLARSALAAAARTVRPALVLARVPMLPFRRSTFDGCISNSLVHHLTDADAFWREIRRICRPGAPVLVMDLHRPPTTQAARDIVEGAAGEEDPILKRDFYNSLLAAFTVDEIRTQLGRTGLGHLGCETASARHWIVHGRLP